MSFIGPNRRGWWFNSSAGKLWVDGEEYEVGPIDIDANIDNHAYFEVADRAEFARKVMVDLD